MANQQANEILESDEKDLVILSYLGRKVFRKTPENEKQRQWWLANSEFTEHDLDLILSMADLFGPAIQLDKCRAYMKCYSEFTEDDLDLILRMVNLFQPMDTSQFDRIDREHINHYRSYSDDQIVGADLPVTYSGLRDLVKRIRSSSAFRESLAIPN
ncbi:hypothetical protein POM88_033068 [Heracleum sosnowskyi]|uniref:Uncharacterized protein n=1 Tax=Heracleum sosnowskyi TaxID=360622 RepID=A0AAD8MI48_9APIA|nr:hypothetical protein POM88_033068 [Heracleum sosnowskyi]